MILNRRTFILGSLFLSVCVLTYVVLQTVQIGGTSIYFRLISPIDLGIDCKDRDRHFSYTQRGSYWILNHYVPGENVYRCNESITYTTHGDVSFLDNIIPLAERWDGPLSVAVYTPGTDYEVAVNSIAYLRKCEFPGIRQRVSFHLVLDERNFPTVVRKLHAQQGWRNARLKRQADDYFDDSPYKEEDEEIETDSPDGQTRVKRSTSKSSKGKSINADSYGLPNIDCNQPAPWSVPLQKTFKEKMNLTYPVNLLRNVARQNAPTHYVLASDSELYPSIDMVLLFFNMLSRNPSLTNLDPPKVFVLPIFEVYSNQSAPLTKTELIEKLKTGLAVPFHQKVCSYCHSVPKSKEWLEANATESLNVFHIAKRHRPNHLWEPIFIGTQNDPLYDERLTWEGKRDKMTQGYALCVLDYDFMILDNAFLVHRPGVKLPRPDPLRDEMAQKQSAFIQSVISKELKTFYGQRNLCDL